MLPNTLFSSGSFESCRDADAALLARCLAYKRKLPGFRACVDLRGAPLPGRQARLDTQICARR